MFWRAGPYKPTNLSEAMKSEEARRAIFGKLMASTDVDKSNREPAPSSPGSQISHR